MAMCFNEELGWVAESLGLKSGHGKRLATKAQSKEESMGLDQLGSKRLGSLPFQELEQNTLEQKRRKVKSKTNITQENKLIGMAERRRLCSSAAEPDVCLGLELSRSWITPSNSKSHR